MPLRGLGSVWILDALLLFESFGELVLPVVHLSCEFALLSFVIVSCLLAAQLSGESHLLPCMTVNCSAFVALCSASRKRTSQLRHPPRPLPQVRLV